MRENLSSSFFFGWGDYDFIFRRYHSLARTSVSCVQRLVLIWFILKGIFHWMRRCISKKSIWFTQILHESKHFSSYRLPNKPLPYKKLLFSSKVFAICFKMLQDDACCCQSWWHWSYFIFALHRNYSSLLENHGNWKWIVQNGRHLYRPKGWRWMALYQTRLVWGLLLLT